MHFGIIVRRNVKVAMIFRKKQSFIVDPSCCTILAHLNAHWYVWKSSIKLRKTAWSYQALKVRPQVLDYGFSQKMKQFLATLWHCTVMVNYQWGKCQFFTDLEDLGDKIWQLLKQPVTQNATKTTQGDFQFGPPSSVPTRKMLNVPTRGSPRWSIL